MESLTTSWSYPPCPLRMRTSRLVLRKRNASLICLSHWSQVSVTVSQLQYLNELSLCLVFYASGERKDRQEGQMLKVKKEKAYLSVAMTQPTSLLMSLFDPCRHLGLQLLDWLKPFTKNMKNRDP